MASPPTAAMVASQFVKKYYSMLCAAPLDLHRFYKEESTFLHSEGSLHEMPVTGLDSIRESIARIGTQGAVVQIDECGSVDAQTTDNGGVLIMVTGEIGFGSQPPRHFVQTFLLAHNNNRNYYVHNDIFRFVVPARAVEAPSQGWAPAPAAPVTVEPDSTEVSAGVENGGVVAEEVAIEDEEEEEQEELVEPETTPQEAPPSYSESAIPASPGALQPPPSPLQSAILVSPPASLPQAGRPLTPPPASPGALPPQQPPQVQAPPSAAPEAPRAPAAPVSWAARLARTMGAAGGADAAPVAVAVSVPKAKAPAAKASPKPVPGWGDTAVASAPATATSGNGAGWGEVAAAAQDAAPSRASPPPARVSTAPDGGGGGMGNGAPPEKESKSLYVKSVDQSMTQEDLREAFSQFGPVHSVSMHGDRGFAFVEFKSTEPVRLVLSSDKPVMVGSKRLNVEAQRPGSTRGSYTDRGGRGSGRDNRGRGRGRGGRDSRGEGDGRGRGRGREGAKEFVPRAPRSKPESA